MKSIHTHTHTYANIEGEREKVNRLQRSLLTHICRERERERESIDFNEVDLLSGKVIHFKRVYLHTHTHTCIQRVRKKKSQ